MWTKLLRSAAYSHRLCCLCPHFTRDLVLSTLSWDCICEFHQLLQGPVGSSVLSPGLPRDTLAALHELPSFWKPCLHVVHQATPSGLLLEPAFYSFPPPHSVSSVWLLVTHVLPPAFALAAPSVWNVLPPYFNKFPSPPSGPFHIPVKEMLAGWIISSHSSPIPVFSWDYFISYQNPIIYF